MILPVSIVARIYGVIGPAIIIYQNGWQFFNALVVSTGPENGRNFQATFSVTPAKHPRCYPKSPGQSFSFSSRRRLC